MALYLHRFTNAKNLAFAVTTSQTGRHPDGAPAGALGEALPIRLNADPQECFSRFLDQIVRVWFEAEQVFRRATPEVVPGAARISIHSIPYTAGSYFAGQSTPTQPLALGPVEDLTLHFSEHDDATSLTIEFEANSDHYTADDLERHRHRFLALLSRLDEAALDAPLNHFVIVGVEERRKLIEEFNANARPVPEAFLPALFETQVARTPEAVAVISGNESLSFSELNTRANRLAHHLIGLGAGPGNLVGIALDQSVDMVVALLATLKAGAAYLPLDPRHPEARIAQMINDAEPVDILTTTTLRSRLPKSTDALNLDAPSTLDLLATLPTRNPTDEDRRTALKPEHAAYVIYTSGSTGTPKGVVIRHRELNHYLDWAGRLYETQKGEGAPVNTPIAFDATVTSLYLPLIAGRPIILLPEQGQIEALAELLASGRELTLVKLTPAHLEALRGLLGPRAANVRARTFVVGGEALPGHLAAYWRQHAPALRIFNEYGPTETVVGCCVYELNSADDLSRDVPIGSPTPNTRLYVLDDSLQPLPIGAIGELFIGGAQIGAGYLGRADLTTERFIADPYGIRPDSVMYRTGDLARWRPDGVLEFLGRADHQIKIRGFRIEPGEIEAALIALPDVAQAVVIARNDGSLGRQLVAYVVPRPGIKPSTNSLRQLLAERLPDYMVPTAYVVLDSLPLTANGKLDRHSLPAPEQPTISHSEETPLIPRNDTETSIAAVWKKVFGRMAINIRDNFFELGGHSLLAVQLISEINHSMKVTLSVLDLFQYPTIEGLATVLTNQSHRQRTPKLIEIQPGTGSTTLFFIYQEGGITEFQLARQLDSEWPVCATVVPVAEKVLHSAARDQATGLPTIEELATAHVRLIQEKQPKEPCLLAGHSFNGLLAFEVARQLQLLGRKVQCVFLLDTEVGHRPAGWFDQEAGPRPFGWWFKNRLPFHVRNARIGGLSYFLNRARDKFLPQSGRATNTTTPTHSVAQIASQIDETVATKWKTLEKIYDPAARQYQPEPIDTPCVLFRVHHTLSGFHRNDRSLGWDGHFKLGLKIIEVQGDHFSMLEEPHVKNLAAEMNAALHHIRHDDSPNETGQRGTIQKIALMLSLELYDWSEMIESAEWFQVF